MTIVNPADSLERQNEKLRIIADALMQRAEEKTNDSGLAYAQFERAALLEAQVRRRTQDLERTLDLLHESNARLAEANALAKEAHDNLADAIETVGDGFALFGADDRLVLSNSRFCREFHDIAGKLVSGLPFLDYVALVSRSRYLRLPDDESADDWAAARIRRHDARESVFNIRLTTDVWLQISEHRTLSGGTVILQTDITEIVQAERHARKLALDRQTRNVRATLDHLAQGVWIFDAAAQLSDWNRRAFELLHLPPRLRRSGQGPEVLCAAIVRRFRFGEGVGRATFLDWCRRPSGRSPLAFELLGDTEQVLAAVAREMPDGGFVVTFTDVTAERLAARSLFEMNQRLERKVEERTIELEGALDRAERANATKSRFVAAASHDLMQPISAAKLFLGSLQDHSSDPAIARIGHKAQSALTGAQHIIETLLDIAKLETGSVSFDLRPVALGELLQALQHQFEPGARSKGLTLQVVPSTLWVHSDRHYLQRILQNLIGNAVRYTQTGRVLIGVRRSGASARVEVWDTGPGIAEEDQSAIFEEFRQLRRGSRESDPDGGGLGLGLAIVERACAALDHPISLWSRPGSGSCFSLNLPLSAQPTRDPASSEDLSPSPRADFTGRLVLLVENDEPLARAVTMMIERWGAYVIHAATGEEALELLSEIDIRPDALLLDYQLGDGIDGVELHRRIAARYGSMPTRIVSANRTRELREACSALGVPLMTKPIERAGLLRFLAQID